MTKTIRELVEFLGNENMMFAMMSEDGMRPRQYLSKNDFLEAYDDWTDEIPIEWFPHNSEDNGTWYSLFIIK